MLAEPVAKKWGHWTSNAQERHCQHHQHGFAHWAHNQECYFVCRMRMWGIHLRINVTVLEERVRVRLGFARGQKVICPTFEQLLSVCYDGISCLKEQSCAFNSWFLDLKDLKWIGWFCWMSSSRRWICLRVSLAWDLFMCEVTSLLHFFLSLATRPC